MNLLHFFGLLVLCALFCLALFGLLVYLMREFGPRRTLLVGCLSSIALAVITYISTPAYAVVVLSFSLASYNFWYYQTRQAFLEEEKLLEEVQTFGLSRFDAISASGDDLIRESDIDLALADGEFALPERVILKHIKAHMEHIGHAIQWCFISSPYSPAVATLPTYGISREDLETYAQRFKAQYGSWGDKVA